jgi:hypothetical protein
MKSKSLKQIVSFVAFVAILASFTSCNKGYGCPNNFSAGDNAVQLVKTVAKVVIDE